jgi:hypothetical protein
MGGGHFVARCIRQIWLKPCLEPSGNGFGRLAGKQRSVDEITQLTVCDNLFTLETGSLTATDRFGLGFGGNVFVIDPISVQLVANGVRASAQHPGNGPYTVAFIG